MKKFLMIAVVAFSMLSCSGYIDKYEDICTDARDRINVATSSKEVRNIMKQVSADIRALNEEYPEDAKEYEATDKSDEKGYAKYQRRVKARNSVTVCGMAKINSFGKK